MLRVIAGKAKGYKLKTAEGMETRPIMDRVKESLFNILMPYIKGAIVLDLYAGSGAVGIEALSRGASKCVFVEKSYKCIQIIKENVLKTRLIDNAEMFCGDVINTLEKQLYRLNYFDIVFIDPPYGKDLITGTLDVLINNKIIKEDAIIVTKSHMNDLLPDCVAGYQAKRKEKYGETLLTFYIKPIF